LDFGILKSIDMLSHIAKQTSGTPEKTVQTNAMANGKRFDLFKRW